MEITEGKPSNNKDSGDWVAYLSFGGHESLCYPDGKVQVPPYTLTRSPPDVDKVIKVTVTSNLNGLTINKFTVDDGKCGEYVTSTFPIVLNSGESHEFDSLCDSTVIKLDVAENWTTTWPAQNQ
jgi:hypothetical protein